MPVLNALCTREDIEALFGSANVSKWADLNNNEDPEEIEARIDRGIVVATDYFYSRVRHGPYTVPFETGAGADSVSSTSDDTLIPPIVVDAVARFAGAWLYDGRGFEDADSEGNPVNKMKGHRDMAEKTCSQILNRTIVLNYPQVTSRRPFVVKET